MTALEMNCEIRATHFLRCCKLRQCQDIAKSEQNTALKVAFYHRHTELVSHVLLSEDCTKLFAVLF